MNVKSNDRRHLQKFFTPTKLIFFRGVLKLEHLTFDSSFWTFFVEQSLSMIQRPDGKDFPPLFPLFHEVFQLAQMKI